MGSIYPSGKFENNVVERTLTCSRCNRLNSSSTDQEDHVQPRYKDIGFKELDSWYPNEQTFWSQYANLFVDFRLAGDDDEYWNT